MNNTFEYILIFFALIILIFIVENKNQVIGEYKLFKVTSIQLFASFLLCFPLYSAIPFSTAVLSVPIALVLKIFLIKNKSIKYIYVVLAAQQSLVFITFVFLMNGMGDHVKFMVGYLGFEK